MKTNELSRKKVFMHRPRKNDPDNIKKAGRIHAFVFHPRKARLVGYLIKRPDIALMFHRSDLFVSIDALEDIDGDLVIKGGEESQGKSAEKSLAKRDGIKLDDCIIWEGLPVIAETGEFLGLVDNVEFDSVTGNVISMETTQGATANTLLGRRVIPASLILGFKRGQGVRLRDSDEEDEAALGSLMVAAEAAAIEASGGVAEKAGEATAVAADKAKRAGKKMAEAASEVSKKVEPKAKEASKSVGAAVQKGAYATGRQIARTEGMFSGFAKELKRAMKDEDDA